jgi:GNAT superfamily N-acetyltransferase
MTTMKAPRLRTATLDDGPRLLRLWGSLFGEDDIQADEPWHASARRWFSELVNCPDAARFPVVDVEGRIVASAIGTLELGVPNPHCPRGRTVRLANVVTLPEHRGAGYGTMLVHDVIEWARTVHADRVDLSATPEGERLYLRAGFVRTTAPRMKLVL